MSNMNLNPNRPSWDEYFCNLLGGIRLRASCPRRAGGALIVDINHNIISTGYNGPPTGLPNCTEHPCGGENDKAGDTSRCLALHAEHNAIYFAGDRRSAANTIYTTMLPCMKCALEILQTPIKRVVFLEDYADKSCRALFSQASVLLEMFTKK